MFRDSCHTTCEVFPAVELESRHIQLEEMPARLRGRLDTLCRDIHENKGKKSYDGHNHSNARGWVYELDRYQPLIP